MGRGRFIVAALALGISGLAPSLTPSLEIAGESHESTPCDESEPCSDGDGGCAPDCACVCCPARARALECSAAVVPPTYAVLLVHPVAPGEPCLSGVCADIFHPPRA